MDDATRNAASLLAKLGKASTLDKFAMSKAETLKFYVISGPTVFSGASGQELLEDWLTTLAHGYRLFLAEQQQYASGSAMPAASLDTLCHITTHLAMSLFNSAMDASQHYQVKMSVMVVRTGFLELSRSLCAALASIINSLNQKQQQQEQARRRQQYQQQAISFIDLAACTLELLSGVAASWPGKQVFMTPALTPVLPAAASLVTAMCRPTPPGGDMPASQVYKSSVTAAFKFTGRVVDTCQCWCESVQARSASWTELPSFLAIGSSAWEALLLHFVLLVQEVHRQQRGATAAAAADGQQQSRQRRQQHNQQQQQSQQQQRKKSVPAGHKQLLTALKVSSGCSLVPSKNTLADLTNRGHRAVRAMMTIVESTRANPEIAGGSCRRCGKNAQHTGNSDGSAGSSSSTVPNNQQQQPPAMALDTSILVPLYLTVLESMLLLPDLHHMFCSVRLISVLSQIQGLMEVQQSANDLQQIASEVLPMVLQQLLPVVQQMEAAEKRRIVPQSHSLVEDLAEVVAVWTVAMLSGDGSGTSSKAAASQTFKQHIKQYCLLLEAAIRSKMRSIGNETSVKICVDTVHELLTLQTCDEASAAADGSSWLTAAGGEVQLLSLLLLLAKANSLVCGSINCTNAPQALLHRLARLITPDNVMMVTMCPYLLAGVGILPLHGAHVGGMWAAMRTVMLERQHQPAGGGTSSTGRPHPLSSDTATSSGAQSAVAAGDMVQLWCVWLARCVAQAGRILQQEQLEHGLDVDSSSCSKDGSAEQRVVALANCREIVIWLKHQLPDAMTAAAADPPAAQQELPRGLKDLMAQAEGLLGQLQIFKAGLAMHKAAQCQSDARGPLSGLRGFLLFDPVDAEAAAVLAKDAAAQAALGQQLEMFGATVCAQLPVQQCCNYHLCCNVAKHSELELVSGKSCVCGSCKTARYCSTACQKAHWHGWHKPVCKRLKQQQKQQLQQ